jgi:hypothetical protein
MSIYDLTEVKIYIQTHRLFMRSSIIAMQNT